MTSTNYSSPIIAGTEDGFWSLNNFAFNNSATTTAIQSDLDDSLATFFRFNSVSMDQGQQITQAILTWYPAASVSSSTVLVYTHKNDNSPVVTSGINIHNRLSQLTSSVSVTGAWTANVPVSVDVTRLVQPIVNRAGWVNGNSILFVLQAAGTTPETKYIYTYESGSTAPTLTVSMYYQAEGGAKVGNSASAGIFVSRTIDASGGSVIGGTAEHSLLFLASGGSVIGGTAVEQADLSPPSSGGILAGGTNVPDVAYNVEASQGVEASGQALESLIHGSLGGVVVGGSAVDLAVYNPTASGGLQGSGTATAGLSADVSAIGGALVGSYGPGAEISGTDYPTPPGYRRKKGLIFQKTPDRSVPKNSNTIRNGFVAHVTQQSSQVQKLISQDT